MHPDSCPGGRKAKSSGTLKKRSLYEITLQSPEGQRSVYSAAHTLADALDSTFPVLDLDKWEVTSITKRGEAP